MERGRPGHRCHQQAEGQQRRQQGRKHQNSDLPPPSGGAFEPCLCREDHEDRDRGCSETLDLGQERQTQGEPGGGDPGQAVRSRAGGQVDRQQAEQQTVGSLVE